MDFAEKNYREKLNEPTYECDLFIAYFWGGNREAGTQPIAERLYEGLKRWYPQYNVCFQPRNFQNNDFKDTPLIAKNKAKAFLIVVDPKTERYPDSKAVRLWKESGEPKSIAYELFGALENEFILDAKNTKGSLFIRAFYNQTEEDGGGFFNGQEGFRAEDFLSPEQREANESLPKGKQIQAVNPFDGSVPFLRDETPSITGAPKEIVAIADWLSEVVRHTKPAETAGKKIYWVGTRKSDIDDCDLFYGSICLFGENDGERHYAYCNSSRRIDHNAPNEAADLWVYETVKAVAEKEKDATFYFYNPSIVYDTRDKDGQSLYVKAGLESRVLCLNSEEALVPLKDKKTFLALCQEAGPKGERIHTIPSVIVKKDECEYDILLHRLCDEKLAKMSPKERKSFFPRFVVQAPVSSGGESTFILDGSARNRIDVFKSLRPDTDYICTEFQENNVPVNVHAIIFPGDGISDEGDRPTILLSSPSIQLSKECDNRIIYRGADFIECRHIHQPLMDEFLRQAHLACERLYQRGYRGICGIDGLILNAFHSQATKENAFDDVCLLEVNARFQASSGLLNKALRHWNDQKRDGRFYLSLQALNLYAFHGCFTQLPDPIRRLYEVVEEKSLPLLEKKLGFYPSPLLNGGHLFSNLPVNFSNFNYINNGRSKQAMMILSLYNEGGEAFRKANYVDSLNLDGLPGEPDAENSAYEPDAHLYRINFTTNLCWVNPESKLYFNQNILDENEALYLQILGLSHEQGWHKRDRMIRVKVALLIQGVRLDKDVALDRPGTFGAVDMVFQDKERFDNYIVNAPVDNPLNPDEQTDKPVKFTGLTPFLIKKHESKENQLVLTYYGETVDEIFLFPTDELAKKTVNGIPYENIAYLSTDRVRVHSTNACKFKVANQGCRFCNIKIGSIDDLQAQDNKTFAMENIDAVLRDYVETYMNSHAMVSHNGVEYYPALRHFLVGGQTMDLAAEGAEKRLVDTVSRIAAITGHDCEIYAMIVPCSPDTIIEMRDAGLTHIAFNVEMYDDELAHEMMPGKRRKDPPRDENGEPLPGSEKEEGCSFREYMEYLEVARRILGTHESARSMLLIGLEPLKNTIRGVKEMLKIDVQPMLSVFRPMPGTDCEHFMSPQIEDVVAVYEEAVRWCKRKQYATAKGYYDPHKRMHLGPDCVPCQNNTVALPYEVEEEDEQLEKEEVNSAL